MTVVDLFFRFVFDSFRRFRIFLIFENRLLDEMLRKSILGHPGDPGGHLGVSGGGPGGVLGLSRGVRGASWEGLGLPFLPQRTCRNRGVFSLQSLFSVLNAPQAIFFSLHFSLTFLLRLGSLWGTIWRPFWAPRSTQVGPSWAQDGFRNDLF